jgi:hypothetical protein
MDIEIAKLSASDEAVRTVRLDQYPRAIVLRFTVADRAWELTVPDHDVTFADVRIMLREAGSLRGAEASVLMPWEDYTKAREWLRCVPDGYPTVTDTEPALTALRRAFEPLIAALSL